MDTTSCTPRSFNDRLFGQDSGTFYLERLCLKIESRSLILCYCHILLSTPLIAKADLGIYEPVN